MKGARRRYNTGSAEGHGAGAEACGPGFSVVVGVASCVLIGYLVNAWAYFVLDAGAGLVREHAFWMGLLTWAQLGILPLERPRSWPAEPSSEEWRPVPTGYERHGWAASSASVGFCGWSGP